MLPTIESRIASMISPTKRRQNPARGPEALPLSGGIPVA
jgi:hypothetical protein